MKKRRVTYGINGYMTYEAIFMAGKTKNKVTFTDGSITATGKRPATFTTDSLMMQHIIENSAEYKKGFIFKYRSLMLNEEVELDRNPNRGEVCEGSCECEHTFKPHPCHDHKKEKHHDLSADVEESSDDWEQANDDESSSEEDESIFEEEEESVTEPIEEVKTFYSNDEAKDFLEAEFGVVKNSLKNRPEIIKAGEANGIKIEFVKA